VPTPPGGVDLRELPTFTSTADRKDFDDAISAERLGGGRIRIWVHIADVSAHVRPGSPVDREAHRRATSVYVPGKVEPMLPEALSNEACSLVPHADPLAVTVELDLEGADVVRTVLPSLADPLRRAAGLPAGRSGVSGEEQAGEPWGGAARAAREVAAALEARRVAQGALAVESAEPEFRFSREGHVTELGRSIQTESHRLIEHLMIAANEAVAGFLEQGSHPALYRIHERPKPSASSGSADQLASLEVPTAAAAGDDDPQQAPSWWRRCPASSTSTSAAPAAGGSA
jgi:ribonuclease R